MIGGLLNMMFGNKNNNNIDITTASETDLARLAFSAYNATNNKKRRDRMAKWVDFYFEKQLFYLNQKFADPDYVVKPKEIKKQPEFFNLTKFIIDKVAKVYHEPPKRDLENATDELKDYYSKMLENSNFDLTMQTANRLLKLCKNVAIRVVYRNNTIDFDLYTPNNYEILANTENYKQADAVIYTRANPNVYDSGTNDKVEYVYFSKEKHFRFISDKNSTITVMSDTNNAENTNPYKTIPFIFLKEGYSLYSFFAEGGHELIATNEILNEKLSEMNLLTRLQAFSILVMQGTDDKNLLTDPSQGLKIPADDEQRNNHKAYYITPDPKIKDLQEDIMARLKRVAIEYGLSPDAFTTSAQKSTAESLQLQAMEENKLIAGDRVMFSVFERQIFEMVKVINNYHFSLKELPMQFPDECELQLNYQDITAVETQEQDDMHNLLLLNNGLQTRAEWLMKINSDIKTIEEAEKILAIKEVAIDADTEDTDTGANTPDNQGQE